MEKVGDSHWSSDPVSPTSNEMMKAKSPEMRLEKIKGVLEKLQARGNREHRWSPRGGDHHPHGLLQQVIQLQSGQQGHRLHAANAEAEFFGDLSNSASSVKFRFRMARIGD
ncbi:hypothetical protein ZIOFF_006474 [Zingiber officinale]|uniref:Uncharacterized protein n=1 Tax=Zingiber officinale TaxID=94328 RepID=A0A8J5IEE1_ZINOF|nr:hypothetical protein ZIOFF_006474 [Zingiber officinale]